MNNEGHLRDLEQGSSLRDDEIRVDMKHATEKQVKSRRVSTKDNKSILGKKLVQHRKKQKISKKSRKQNRSKK